MGLLIKKIKNPKTKFGQYFQNVLVAHDQLLGSFLGIDPDETISSHLAKCKAGEYRMPLWGKVIYPFLEKIDPGHCERATEKDEGKNTVRKRRKK